MLNVIHALHSLAFTNRVRCWAVDTVASSVGKEKKRIVFPEAPKREIMVDHGQQYITIGSWNESCFEEVYAAFYSMCQPPEDHDL